METRFDISNYKLNRSFPEGKNKKVIGLGWKIMTKCVGLRAKTWKFENLKIIKTA